MIRSAILDYVGRKAGMDYFSLRMHRELCKLGTENILYTNFGEPNDPGVQHVFPFESRALSRGRATLGYLRGILRTFRGIRRQKSQHFIFHYFKGGLPEALVLMMARWHSQCIHLLVHDVESLDTSNDHNRLKGFIANSIRKWILHQACDYAYTFSQAAADELLQREPGLRERLTVLHHGHFLDLPLPEPSREQARRDLLIEEGTVTLLFFGQIKASKGPEVLLQALEHSRDPRLRLIIAGKSRDYNIEEALRQWTSADTRSRIRLINRYITDAERDRLFKACDAVVLPYHRIYNSGVLMMALSYGRPVIASNLPANREIIQDDRLGLLFEAGNATQLSKKIQNFIELSHPNTSSAFVTSYLIQSHSWLALSHKITGNVNRNCKI